MNAEQQPVDLLRLHAELMAYKEILQGVKVKLRHLRDGLKRRLKDPPEFPVNEQTIHAIIEVIEEAFPWIDERDAEA